MTTKERKENLSPPYQVLTNEHHKIVAEIIDKEVAEFIDKLPRIINKHLSDHVSTMLGFERSFGRTEVRNGRESTIKEFLSEEVKVKVKEEIAKIGVDFEPSEEMLKTLRATYVRNLNQNIREALRKRAEVDAQRIVDTAAKGAYSDINGGKPIMISTDPADHADPIFGTKNELDRLALERTARELSEGKL